MPDAADGFSSLPVEFQRVLRAAEERNGLTVTSLDQLVGGRSGAAIHLVSVASNGSHRLEHCILKLDRSRPSARAGEVDRHRAALAAAPAAFARSHMAEMAFDPVEHEGAVAIFYRIAGQSLQSYRPLSSYARQTQLGVTMAAATRSLLEEWNPEPTFAQATSPQDLLRRWLGFRLKPEGHLDRFLRDVCRLPPETPGFLVGEKAFRNPIAYARDPRLWAGARPVDALLGFQHGDLNTNNVLLRFDATSEALDGYYLIDFAAFQAGMPLLYDQRYLEMSYLLLAMARMPFSSTVALLTRLSDEDVPDPHRAPVEAAGPCAVIAAGRREFRDWVVERHPSLQDDLWAQYWLAGVAAGLAYCHKPPLTDEQRLAGLLYACANLERYATALPLPAPTEVKLLVDQGRLVGAPAAAGPSGGPGPRSNLPTQVTPFLGREAELARGQELLRAADVRLLTLTGPGGIGKTRLALQLAAASLAEFPDGVLLVDLAPAREPEQVLGAIARTVGLRSTGDRPLLVTLTDALADRRMLLLLDNFEQVLAATPLVAELLRACPGLTLLVTSREALHLRGEHILPVPVLGLPDLAVASPERLRASEAVRLFVERAQAVQPDFRLTGENAGAVAEICLRLDGLPLAIELAAARVALLSPQALLERLSRPLTLLKGGPRDLPARQQTLRDTIEWSYGLLTPAEQRLFALLSVFAGATLAAVESVATAVGLARGLDVLDGVTSLLDKNLLRPVDPSAAVPRLQMLETIRAYATDQLDEDTAAAAAARGAHAAHFAELARTLAERLSGKDRQAALQQLEAEIDNLRSAWRYCVAAGDLERLQVMTHGLWSLYDARGWYHATATLAADLLQVLAATPSTPERAQQEILLQTSLARVLLATKGYTQEVEAAYTRALELCGAYGHVPELFPVLRGLSSYYTIVAEFEKGARIGEQILRLAEQQDDAGMRVEGHLVMASCVFGIDPQSGLDHLDRALAEYDPELYASRRYRFGSDPGVPCYTTSALILWLLGFPDRARKRSEQALALAERLNHPFSTAYASFHMGLLALWRREPEAAEELARNALRIADEQNLEIWRALALCLGGAALVELRRVEEGLGQLERGIGLYRRLKTPPVFWPLLLLVRAGVAARAGRPTEGLALLDEALAIVEPGAPYPMNADMCRLKGELLLVLHPDRVDDAEPWFRQGIEIAERRDERMLELRAAVGLGRLLRDRGRVEEGRRVVRDAYGKLTEGFGTADALEASALLAG